MRGADARIALGLYRSRHDRGTLEGALAAGIRDLDTSFNYSGFASHRTLATLVPDLLPEFTISTKIGYFPGDGQHTAHHLTPELLRYGAELTVEDLGTVPAVMLLHNPEESLSALPANEAYDRFTAACAELAEAKSAGLCGEWGISSWNPAPVLAALAADEGAAVPRPDIVMVRAGMLVSADALDRAEELFEVLNVPFAGRWGMSPFGGHAQDRIWNEINARTILDGQPMCNQHQAAFRLAYALPAVQRVAVGTDNPLHLRDLISATTLDVDRKRLSTCRTLLREYAQKGRESVVEIG